MADPLSIPGIGVSRVELDPSQMRVYKPSTTQTSGQSFKEVLTGAVNQVQQLQTEADTTIKKLVAGEINDVSEAMVAVEKADVAFQTMMNVRNKVVSAYEEIMRTQV